MTKYTATFADGTTITRSTKRQYAVAWRASWDNHLGGRSSDTGFSYSRDAVNAFKPKPYVTGRGFSANERAAARRKNQEYIDSINYRVEIVPAVAA